MELYYEEIYLIKINIYDNGLKADNRYCEIIRLQSGLPYLSIPYLSIFNVLDFVPIITRKLIETNCQSF